MDGSGRESQSALAAGFLPGIKHYPCAKNYDYEVHCMFRRSPFTLAENSASYTQMRWSGGGGGRTGGAAGRDGGIRGGGCAAAAAAAVWASYVIVLFVEVFRTGPRRQTGQAGRWLDMAQATLFCWKLMSRRKEAARNNIPRFVHS